MVWQIFHCIGRFLKRVNTTYDGRIAETNVFHCVNLELFPNVEAVQVEKPYPSDGVRFVSTPYALVRSREDDIYFRAVNFAPGRRGMYFAFLFFLRLSAV